MRMAVSILLWPKMVNTFEANVPFICPLKTRGSKKGPLTWNWLIPLSKTVESNVNFIKKTPGLWTQF